MAAVPRLKQRREFLRVAAVGRKWVAAGLILQAMRHPADERARASVRVGFTVSRKVGGAVVRNRVRRRLRAAMEKVFPGQAAAGYDFVIIGRAATVKRSFGALVGDLETALRRLGAHREDGKRRADRRAEAGEA